jgi:signal transduction histidine kinase
LERLGLVPGITAFCKEFTAQQRIKVIFSHDEPSRSAPSDIALSLFRIVQECLRNVAKHSGASEARVTLTQQDHHLHLAVSDDGAGFDPDDERCKQGLGLFSMEERARLIGARLKLRAEPGRGAHIEVWVPIPASEISKKAHTA